MLFAEYERVRYARPQLVEVICQLRFPAILTIGAEEPAAFQEAVRQAFPRYAAQQEQLPPKFKPGNPPTLEAQKPITNYSFISGDGAWKLNLTQNFLSLSTRGYQNWEDFAARLDRAAAEFCRIYQPAFFERVGLRYMNAFSRNLPGLEDCLWDDLIQDQWLGILGQPDLVEQDVGRCTVDVECVLAGGCRMKVRAGPGRVGNPKTQEGEIRFVLDGDFSATGEYAADALPARLEDLHRYAVRIFRGAITKELHEAMGPTEVCD